jgi:hypothetical protein
VGKNQRTDRNATRAINVEIAPGNQEKLDLYIRAYNHKPERAAPKIKYTDVVNDALDRFFGTHQQAPRARIAADNKK